MFFMIQPDGCVWVNKITTSRRDRTLESWFIRKIIPKGPNYSGQWNILIYPDVWTMIHDNIWATVTKITGASRLHPWGFVEVDRSHQRRNIELEVSIHGGSPIAGWFIMEHPIKLDDLGILGNLQFGISNICQWQYYRAWSMSRFWDLEHHFQLFIGDYIYICKYTYTHIF